MPDDAAIARVRAAAGDLAQLALTHLGAQAVGGLVVGGAYSLVRALELEYVDATGTKLAPDYERQLADSAAAIRGGTAGVSSQWLSAFYFNDALIRLAVARERLKTQQGARDRIPSVKEEVNIFKHEFEGLLPGRHIDVLGALTELETTLAELRRHVRS